MKIVSRIAPTPNGEIHWGNLMNFVLTWSYVKQNGGELILRFDDIDSDRCLPQYAQNIRDILSYIELDFDRELSRQILRKHEYFNLLNKLPHYVCNCSRQDIMNRTGDHYYDGYCRNKNNIFDKGKSSFRFLAHKESLDFVIWRKEDLPAYQLTSIKDDLDLGVNVVVRGEDLIESTLMQQQMLKSLNVEPIRFIHHRLITNADGVKLSKSRNDGDLMSYVQSNKPPSQIFKQLAFLMGLDVDKYSCLNDFLSLKLDDFLV